MTFKRGDHVSIFGALKPASGQMVTRAIITTYSLDLVALLGLVLSLGGDAEAEFENSPLGLVKAFDRMRGKLVVLHQLGRVIVPSAHRSVLPLLDTMVLAIHSNERHASWHPKIALVRYEGVKNYEWRFWIGSRNLTGSTDLDAGLLLVSSRDKLAKPIPKIADLAKDLLKEAQIPVGEVEELKSARWKVPAGVSIRDVLWRRNGQTKSFVPVPMIPHSDRGCAMSPFINHDGLDEVLKAGAPNITLLTTEMAGAGCAPHEKVKFRVDTPPEPGTEVSVEQQQEEANGEFITPPSMGIHGKVVAVSKGDRTAFLLGSANLTNRGLIGPNAEAVILLDVVDQALVDSFYNFVNSGLELNITAPDPTVVERERAKRELDCLISIFLEMPMKLCSDQDGMHLIIGKATADVLTLARFEASAFLQDDAWALIEEGKGSVRLLAHQPVLSEQTTLVMFRACSKGEPEVCRTWVQSVEVDGLDAKRRDQALLARYVGTNRFRDWLISLLEGIDQTGDKRWSDPWKEKNGKESGSQFAKNFTLETMLVSWARDRKAFEDRVDGMMAMLDSFEEVFVTIPDEQEREAALRELEEVRPFLRALHEAIEGAS